MKIETNKYVTLAYELHVGEDEERELMECYRRIPQSFFGTNSMLQSFEAQLRKVTGILSIYTYTR